MTEKEMFSLSYSFLVCCLFTTILVLSKNDIIHEAIATAVGGFESKNSCITYVVINGFRYIVKQKKDPSKQFSVVRDALAAYIAKDLAIAHSVEIIPSKNNLLCKKLKLL